LLKRNGWLDVQRAAGDADQRPLRDRVEGAPLLDADQLSGHLRDAIAAEPCCIDGRQEIGE